MNASDTTAARDRAIGALVGLAVGDAVGTTLEFQAPGSFTPISEMIGGGPFGLHPGQWTDDTSMAMCLAESILDVGSLDATDQLRRYVSWYRNGYWSSTGTCFDIGSTTIRGLSRFEDSGAVTDLTIDENGAANGSLMRLAAVPIRWHTDIARAAHQSGESSRTTHAAARPVDACRVMGAMIAGLITGQPADQVFDPGFWQFGALHPEVEAVTRGSWRRRQPPEIRGSGYSVDALEAALWAVGHSADFREAVLRAANLGDDADTTAAIAGQLAGARWGWSGIPVSWRTQITEAERIRAIGWRLFDAAIGGLTELPWPHDRFVHAYWVRPGSVLAGEYPGDVDPIVAAQRVNLLIDHGVRTFIDLTRTSDGLAAYDAVVRNAAAARRLDIRRITHPIPNMGVLDQDGYDRIVASLQDASDRGAVYVHCWGGIGRTATVVGCLLVDGGMTANAAFTQIDQWRAGTRKAGLAAPQTEAQRAVVRARSEGARHT